MYHTSPGFLNYLSNFLGVREPIRNANGCPTLVIFAVAGEEGNFRSSLREVRCFRKTMFFSLRLTVGIVEREKTRFLPQINRTGHCSSGTSKKRDVVLV